MGPEQQPKPAISKADALAEAYKRGLLPPDKKAAYEEAQKRGLVGAPQPAQPSNGAGMGSVNPMVEMGLRAQAQLPAGYARPEAINQTNPIIAAQRASQTQAGNAWAAQEEARKAEEARLRQELKEANALSAGGGGLPLYRNESGDIRPGSPTDTDLSKGIVASPIHAERAAVSAAEATANLPLDIAKASAVPVTAMFDPSFQGAMAGAEYGVGVDTLSDRLSQAYEAGGYGDLQKKMDAGQRLDFSGAKIPVPDELQSVSGSVAEGFMQYLFARGLVGKMMPGGKLPLQLTKDTAALGAGFLGDTGRTADMLDPETMGVMKDYVRWLQTNESDSPFMGRIKNMTEDATINLLLMGLGRGGKALANAADGVAAVPTNAGGNWRNAPAAVQPPPATAVPPTRPAPPPVQPQAAAQAAQPTAPVQTATAPPIPPQPPVGGPPVAAGAAGNPPGVPVAQAAQTPPPGTLTPAGNGVAVDSFNNLPVKTREGVLRAMEASGMTRQQAFDAIRSLNDLPPERANMFEFELIRRFGGPDQFPNLQANLTAMGSDFSIQTAKKGGSPQEVMNKSLLDQAQSEGEYLTRMAEDIFGEGKVATKQELETFRNQLGGQYQKQLAQTYPGMTRMRSPQAKLDLQARIDPARKELTEYLLRPEVMEDVPQWVRDQVMLQVADDLRFIRLDDAGQQFRIQQNPELAPLLTPDRPLRYSPQLWKTLVEMYPTQVGHSLQSAYRQAIDEAYSGISNAVDRTTAKKLKRMRGESRVRSNAADPNKRGYGLLHLLEQASPGYKEIRQQFGDVVGAQKAADMPNTFFRDAKDEEALANFIDVYDNELTPLQQEAVRNGITTQIRQALKNKTEFTQPWELDAIERGHLPNLTAVSSQPFLEALPRVFGRDGERMADAIRLSRANIDNIQAINKNFASGTPKGMEIRENAKNLYEHPSATNINPIDNATSTMAGLGLASAMAPGGQVISAAMLGGATMRGLYRAYKRGKSLTPGQKEALADWLFKPRRATDAAPPTTPRRFSKIGYAGNVLTGAGVGAGVAAATGQDPTTGALAGAVGGGVRAGLRGMRAERSIIKPPPAGPRGGNRLRTGGNPPPAVGPRGAPRIPPGDAGFAGVTPLATMAGGTGGFLAAPDVNGDGAVDMGERAAFAALGTAGGYGAGRKLSKPRPAGNALKSGPAKAPAANVTALPKSDKANSSDLQKALQAYIDKPRTKWDDALEQGKINRAEYDWYSGGGTAEELQKTKANMLETLKTAEGYPADRVWEVYSKDPSAKMALELLAADGNQRAMAIRYEAERMRAIPRQTKRMWAIMGEPEVSVAPLADLAGSIGDDVAIETAKSFARMSEQPFLVARAKTIKTADEAYALLRDAHKLINGKDGRPAWADRLIRDARNNDGKFTPPKAKATPKADVVPFGAAQKAPPASPPVKPSGASKPPPVEAAPPAPANKLKAPPKPKGEGPGIVSRMVTGGVIGGLAGSLGGDAQGQEDLTAEIRKAEGQISAAEQEIAALKKAKADFDKITDPFEKQRFLKAQGLYAGKIEGDIAGKTTEGINAWDAKNAAALKKAEADLAASKANLTEMRKRDAQRQMQKEQNPFADALREFGPTGSAIIGSIAAGVFRVRAVGKSAKAVKAIENDINDLLTSGPVKNLVKKGGAANVERNRAVNMNQFYRQGGAPDNKLPFNYGSSGWKPNPKAAKVGSLFPRKTLEEMDGVGSSRIRPNDVKLIGFGLIEPALVTPFVENAQRELDEAEIDAKNNPDSVEALRRVERAKTNLAMYQALQRAGWGLAAGGVLSAGYRYKLPKPDIRGAEDEVTAISDYLKTKAPPMPVAPPKAPPAPPPQTPAAPSNQLLLPLGPPPKKPKKPKKP